MMRRALHGRALGDVKRRRHDLLGPDPRGRGGPGRRLGPGLRRRGRVAPAPRNPLGLRHPGSATGAARGRRPVVQRLRASRRAPAGDPPGPGGTARHPARGGRAGQDDLPTAGNSGERAADPVRAAGARRGPAQGGRRGRADRRPDDWHRGRVEQLASRVQQGGDRRCAGPWSDAGPVARLVGVALGPGPVRGRRAAVPGGRRGRRGRRPLAPRARRRCRARRHRAARHRRRSAEPVDGAASRSRPPIRSPRPIRSSTATSWTGSVGVRSC
jgi:hypothetical protein